MSISELTVITNLCVKTREFNSSWEWQMLRLTGELGYANTIVLVGTHGHPGCVIPWHQVESFELKDKGLEPK